MFNFVQEINTCFLTRGDSGTIAYYSHLIPIVFSLALALLVLIKSKKNIFSKIFFTFAVSFSLWLIGDLVLWTQNNYFLQYASWAPLDYIEIVFYIIGLYFIMVFAGKKDIPIYQKIILLVFSLPPFLVTILSKSVNGFNYPVCEVFNNNFLGNYKLILEVVILIVILVYLIRPFLKKELSYSKRESLIVVGSMFLFLAIFGITEYIASNSGYYELNLYSLFIVPIFLIAITYSIFNLNIFNVKVLGTYFLVFGFLILMATQLLFVSSGTDRILTSITVVFSAALSFVLFNSLRKEANQLIQIAKLNTDLNKLVQQRESLVHLVTHKVKGSFTRTKYIFAGMLDNMFGPLTPEMEKVAKVGLESDDNGVKTVDLILNASNLQKGTVKYDMKLMNFKDLVDSVTSEKRERIEEKGLKLNIDIKESEYNINGDAFWLKEVVNNLIENAFRYTKDGTIDVSLQKINSKIFFTVKDTGIGMSDEDRKSLFTEGGRGKESIKVNVDSTGYGLYTVKLVVDAHGGKVSAESDGPGKGSKFSLELNAI